MFTFDMHDSTSGLHSISMETLMQEVHGRNLSMKLRKTPDDF